MPQYQHVRHLPDTRRRTRDNSGIILRPTEIKSSLLATAARKYLTSLAPLGATAQRISKNFNHPANQSARFGNDFVRYAG